MATFTSGKQVKPVPEDPKALINSIYGVHVLSIRELDGYFDTNYHVIVDRERWDNPNIAQTCPHGYVFKVMNIYESQTNHADVETIIQNRLEAKGFICPKTVLTKEGDIYKREFIDSQKCFDGMQYHNVPDEDRARHMCRLQTYVPGSVLVGTTLTPQLLYDIGQYLADIHDVLKDIEHAALDSYQTIWSLDNLPRIKEFSHVVNDKAHKQMVEDILEAFQCEVLSNTDKFSKGVIHGDINGANILVRPKDDSESGSETTIQGIIDFGDSLNSLYIYELGVAVMHLTSLSWSAHGLAAGGHVLAGYLSRRGLRDVELAALRVCVAGRYTQILVMGDYSLSRDPENVYAHRPDGCGWEQLTQLWNTPREQLRQIWQDVINSYR